MRKARSLFVTAGVAMAGILLAFGLAVSLSAVSYRTTTASLASLNSVAELSSSASFYRGFNYTTWQTGRYPFSTSWVTQTYVDSQAIRNVAVSSTYPYAGRGALAMNVDLRGGHPNLSQGEVFVDLRYYPPLCSETSYITTPLGLSGVTISATVYAPFGSDGDPAHPNGLQIFAKDSEYDSYYGPWFNITSGIWNVISATVTSGGAFDANDVILVGLKIGADTGSTTQFSGTLWLDNYGWHGDCRPQYPFENVDNALDTMRTTDANAVALVATWYTPMTTSDTIDPDPSRTPTDAEIERTIQEIHNRNMIVLLKPHLDVLTDEWRGTIAPGNPSQWFMSYTHFITHYATIAQAYQVEMLAIGTELSSMVTDTYQTEWNSVIDDVRAVYTGSVIYAANWDNYSIVPDWFWSRMDKTGIDAYFPLSDESDPTLQELVSGWSSYSGRDWVQEITDWQQTTGKSIIFTEIGYASYDGATKTPWAWCDRLNGCNEPYNGALQAHAYEAAMQVWKTKPWFEGVFWWMWDTASDAGGPGDLGYTPQNKPINEQLSDIWKFYVHLPIVMKDGK